MNVTKDEIEAAQQVEAQAEQICLAALADMQLALLGSGTANEIFG